MNVVAFLVTLALLAAIRVEARGLIADLRAWRRGDDS